MRNLNLIGIAESELAPISFILTMRNLNGSTQRIHGPMVMGFILTMRNLNIY